MTAYEDVCVLIPTLNEATTIGQVVGGFLEVGFEHVLVVDGASTDDTTDIAREHGARVVCQSGRGKGQAVREGLEHVDRDVVLLVDGDGTYRPRDGPALVEPIVAGEAEHVIGDRFADLQPGSMTWLNRVGNRLINQLFTFVHGQRFGDILSGYRAFTRASVDRMHLNADGFGIETELAVECVRHRIPTTVVDVSYQCRPDGSETNLRPIRDGGLILSTVYRLGKTTNPVVYFGAVGVVSMLCGVGLATFVAFDWFVRGVPHQILAVVAGVGVLFGIQLLTFGILSEMIVSLRRYGEP